jgi:RNA recognition motif-containing protein
MKLFVGSLPFDFTDQSLQDLFEPHGTVTSAKIILDRETGRSRGFGFVEMSSEGEAQAAIQALNDSTQGGRTIVVKKAHDREERPPRRERDNRGERQRY